jgi:hypothetical protein
MSKPSDERMTPPEVWRPLNAMFEFDIDPCTSEDNPLAMPYFFTEADSGLTKHWAGYGNKKVFVNPPYTEMLAWAEKTVREAALGCFVAFILPNDSTTKAYQLLEAHAWGKWRPPFRVKFLTRYQPRGKQKPGPDGLWRVDVARSHVVFFLGGFPCRTSPQ